MNKLSVALYSLTLLLCSIGLLMIYDTTSAEIIDRSSSVSMHHALLKQMLHGLLGIGLGFFIYKVGYQNILKHSWPILIFFTALLVLVFVPHIGLKLNGAKRWIRLFGFSFQPSEFMKIIIPFAFIRMMQLKSYQVDMKDFIKSTLPFLIPLFLILIEPDNGTVAIILSTMVILFFLCRVNWRFWAGPILALSLVGGVLAFQLPYVRSRINVYLHPEQDLLGKGHQPYQAKIAAGAGGFLGRGMGQSMQKLSYLPEARSDYIAAIYAEEFGFVGIFFLTVLYMSITLVGFLIALRARDREGLYLAASLTFLLAFQAFLNLGVVCGLLPSKGTNLPLFSHGGTSLIANFAIIAILLNIGSPKWSREKCLN
ncbi:MAG: putative peptidoglycan glycosyltransferase FtsW [Rhabdochlamydiaceae bacterium]|nr:putative peptidoglycan glycosyltransferase FtsW [Candidatus Amphrikana amoebophyrae]